MKHLFLLLLLLQQHAGAQVATPPPIYGAQHLILPEKSALAKLAQELTRFSKTEKEKVTAIFYWVAGNIDYRVKPNAYIKNTRRKMQEDTSMYLPPLDLRIAEEVLEKRVAVCEGYARLFKTLCLYAGIPCEVITGFAKNGVDRTGKRFQSNHNWNAVYFDSAWHLLDVTWASGYISFSNQFVRRLDERYFLTDPIIFLEDHYPEDLRWTLLEQPPAPREFFNTPFKPQNFVKKQVIGYSPLQGYIEANLGDSILLEMRLKDASKKVFLIDDRYQQTTLQQGPLYEAVGMQQQGQFVYIAQDANVKWLSFLVEDDVVLKYRLEIKKPAKELLLPVGQ